MCQGLLLAVDELAGLARVAELALLPAIGLALILGSSNGGRPREEIGAILTRSCCGDGLGLDPIRASAEKGDALGEASAFR